ncbi:hypothetical protein BofuT4_uP007790.1 [Botrytis cinerea T4]|uniref:Uncharacterized protein n=1 Tax=Botryotinia fuckeliana (strain T4) TaxID=999810 RepID=G2XXM3_BOTF4|nr:hypothetical protein BofuT4_uP007790.1 [Botrytis cinerea T4]
MSGISRNSKRHDVGAKMEHPCWHARGKGLTPMAQMRLSQAFSAATTIGANGMWRPHLSMVLCMPHTSGSTVSTVWVTLAYPVQSTGAHA